MERTQETKKVEYRELTDYPGYRVGDDGSVWCCRGQGGNRGTFGEWRPVKPRPQKHGGHLVVKLWINGAMKQFRVHRLVLEAFVGLCPPGQESRHFPDCDPTNNHLSNLQWSTKLVNQRDRVIHGTDCRGEKHGLAKLTWEKVRLIHELSKQGKKQREIARIVGISQPRVGQVLRGEGWKTTPSMAESE